MNRPSLSVRLAGSPDIAILLFFGYGAVVWSWYQGDVAWWLAVAAVAAAGRTLKAVRRVRDYKAWLADWEAMGGEDEPQRPKKRRSRGRMRATAAALLMLGILLLPEQLYAPWASWLVGAWWAACLYLVFVFVRGSVRQVMKRYRAGKEAGEAVDEAAPVAWLVGRPSFSSSRAAAQRNLPEYCARLIDRQRVDGAA